jgi:hypothetical protein
MKFIFIAPQCVIKFQIKNMIFRDHRNLDKLDNFKKGFDTIYSNNNS